MIDAPRHLAVALPDPESVTASLDRGPRRAADLELVLRAWPGLRVGLEQLDGPGYLIILGEDRGEILVRAQDPLPRRRYTVAHELAHWYLATEISHHSSPDLTCERNTTLERWCEHFAAALLLPRQMLAADAAQIDGGNLSRAVPGLARAYRVSRQALRIRLN